MKFVYNGYVYDDDFVQRLNEKCGQVKAHGFNDYLKNSRYGGISPIDQLRKIRKETEDFKKYDKEKSLKISQEELLQIVKDFYKQLTPELSQKVDSILDKENPNPNYKIELITDPNDERFGRSFAEHSGNNAYIYVQISLNGTVEGLRIATHEMSHAISGHNTKKIELVKELDENKFMDYIHSIGKYSRDCIGEIESHIIEYLFMEYLVDREIISNDDFKNFETIRHNSFLDNINLIREEYDILSHVNCPITVNDFEHFVKKINTPIFKTNRFKSVMNRSKFMAERNQKNNTHNAYSQYRYRYVIGEIVSTLWYESYCQSSKEEKQEMIDGFVDYLSQTDSLELDGACDKLLGLKIGETFASYLSHVQEKTVQ